MNMFKRGEDGAVGGETIIAQGVKVEGDFTASGNVVIEGEVSGSVSIGGDLHVGQGARIEANVKARSATIAGEIQGNITVADTLDLGATSSVVGDVSAQTLVVAAGASVNGSVTMGTRAEKSEVE